MGVFSKIFGSASKKVAGDEGHVLVPVYLESIAAGANPKTQVQKIRAIVGDSDKTFNEYLGELEMAGDEKPEIISKAVDIVTKYYKDNMVGDEKTVKVEKEDKDGKEEKNVQVDKDGKETKDIKVEKDGDKKKVEVKEAGDESKDKKEAGDGCGGMKLSGDEIDAIAQKTAAILMAAQTPKTVAGDEVAVPLNGDSTQDKDARSSDDFLKDLWG